MNNPKKGKHDYDRVVLLDLYKKFRHKYRDPNKRAGHYTFPKKEISSHPYALEFKEWKLIVQVFMKHLFEYLKEGHSWKLPYKMGYWQMFKHKTYRHVYNYKKGRELMEQGKLEKGQFIKERKYFFNGYYPRLIWLKHHSLDIAFSNMTRVKVTLSEEAWESYWKELKDPKTAHKLYNLNDL